MSKVNLADKFSQFEAAWTPKIVGKVNNFHVKLAKFRGDFQWHSHKDEDELFLVVKGTMRMAYRDRTEIVGEGEFIIVPRGVEHCAGAESDECHVLLLEPATTVNTGDGEVSELTVTELEEI